MRHISQRTMVDTQLYNYHTLRAVLKGLLSVPSPFSSDPNFSDEYKVSGKKVQKQTLSVHCQNIVYMLSLAQCLCTIQIG